MNEESFQRWLTGKGYRPSTVTQTLREVRRGARHWHESGELLPEVEHSLRRYATFLREQGPSDDFGTAVAARGDLKDVRGVGNRPRRKRVARSFEDSDWHKLGAALAADDSPEGTVLLLMATTGHRVGDILRVGRSALTEAQDSGVLLLERKGGDLLQVPLEGARQAWDRLHNSWRAGPDDIVADWVCPECAGGPEAGGGAYKRVQRKLKRLGAELGMTGRVHLHRMRRTVGVRALRTSGDVHLVSQLLGHRRLSTTEGYVDEVRSDDVAELQKKLRGEE